MTKKQKPPEPQVEQESVDINAFVEALDLSLVVARTRPSLRTKARPQTYTAWIPQTILVEDNAQPAGFGDSMSEAVAALAEAMSGKIIRVVINGAKDEIIVPTVTTESFGSDE